MSSQCQICACNSKKVLKCPCGESCCKKCAERYILSKDTQASCMFCYKVWDQSFVITNFSKRFQTIQYRNHLENIFFKNETKYLPSIQLQIECDKKVDILKVKIKEINKIITFKSLGLQKYTKNISQIWRYRDMMKSLRTSERIKERIIKDNKFTEVALNQIYENSKKNLQIDRENIKALRKTKKDLNDKIKMLKANLKEPEQIIKCPNNDCRGFVCDSNQCGLCKSEVCMKCKTLMVGIHQCNSDILKSVEKIEKDSKPCPNCRTLIHKESGCMQMFCVVCRIAFDWKTMKIEKGLIHNPHYFDYLRSTNQSQLLDSFDQCAQNINGIFYDMFRWRFENDFMLLYKLRKLITFKSWVERSLIETGTDDLKTKYLKKEISESTFKSKLYLRFHKNEKIKEMNVLIATYVDSITDLFHNFFFDKITRRQLQDEALVLEFYISHHYAAFCKTYSRFSTKSNLFTGMLRCPI